jgi:hypothetical protein
MRRIGAITLANLGLPLLEPERIKTIAFPRRSDKI